jgi:hypothetical protein
MVVLQAFTHTMFDTSIDVAWHTLCLKLDAAAIAAQADRTHSTSAAAGYLGDVAKAHEDYLAAVHRACWLPKDANSQVCTCLLAVLSSLRSSLVVLSITRSISLSLGQVLCSLKSP